MGKPVDISYLKNTKTMYHNKDNIMYIYISIYICIDIYIIILYKTE